MTYLPRDKQPLIKECIIKLDIRGLRTQVVVESPGTKSSDPQESGHTLQ